MRQDDSTQGPMEIPSRDDDLARFGSPGSVESDASSLENISQPRLISGGHRSSLSSALDHHLEMPASQNRRGKWGSIRHRIRKGISNTSTTLATALGVDPENLEEVIKRGTLGDVTQQRQAAEVLQHTSANNPHRLMKGMGQLPWVETLIDFASSDDAQTQRVVAKTLVLLAEHGEYRLNLVEAGLLQPLIYLRTNCTDSTTQALATEALDRLGVYNHMSLLQLVNIQGMAPLRYLGGCSDIRAQRTAASVLASLLEDSEARMDIVRGDGFRTVLGLATSNDEYIQTIASIAVNNLPITNLDLGRIVEEGSLPGVVSLVRSPKPEFQIFATTILSNAIAIESFSCESCSLFPIADDRYRLATANGDVNLCHGCATKQGVALPSNKISVSTRLRERIVADGGHTALIQVSRCGTYSLPSVQASLEDGTSSPTVLQHLAVRGLASLVVKSSHAAEINKQDGMPVLVDLLIHSQYLADNSLAILRNATRALANLSSCAKPGTWQREAIARSILAARALQPLLVLTLHQDTEVVRHSSRVLAELASVCVAPVFCDEDAHSGHSASDSPDYQPDGLTPRSGQSLGSNLGSNYSFGTVDTPSVASSASSISNFSPYRSSRSLSTMTARRSSGNMQPQIIQECDGVEWLCILSSHEDWVVKRSAALIFERLSAAAHLWLAQRTAGIISAVVSLAGEDDQITRQHAKVAVAALSKYDVFQSSIVMEPQLRSILLHRDEDGIPDKRLTSVILRYLTASDECRHALLDQAAGAEDVGRSVILEEVLRLMKMDDPEIKSNLAWVIGDISLDSESVPHLCTVEVINMIIDLARADDEPTQTNAAITLSNVCAHQPTKELLGELGIVPVLIKLVGSQNAETTKHAVLAMDHLSQGGPLDLPMGSPRKADQIIRVVIGQQAHLVQVAGAHDGGFLSYGKLLACIEAQVEPLASASHLGLATCDIVYLDSEHKGVKISDQDSLNKVLKFHEAETFDSSKSLTFYLSVQTPAPRPSPPLPENTSQSSNGGVNRGETARRMNLKDEDDDDRLPIDTLLEVQEDQLDFRDRIGVGACGEVFHGYWRGVDVAIKCLFTDGQTTERELIKDFRNEVRMMMQLRHPNICLFMGAVIKHPRLCIISEFCHRGSLYRILHKSEKPLPWLRRVQMALDGAKGCHFLHTHEPCIVHRDLKSPNLLVDKHWTLKVGDFGLARTKSHFYVSMGAGGVGTPEWTAPEVLKDEPFNEKADVYSFGVILWELCTRKRPFRGLTQMQVVVAVGFNGERLPPVSKPDVDPILNELMVSCMAEKWEDRPAFGHIVVTLKNIVKRYEEKQQQQQRARNEKKKKKAAGDPDPNKEAQPVILVGEEAARQIGEEAVAKWLAAKGMGHLALDLAVAFEKAGYSPDSWVDTLDGMAESEIETLVVSLQIHSEGGPSGARTSGSGSSAGGGSRSRERDHAGGRNQPVDEKIGQGKATIVGALRNSFGRN